MMVPSIVRVLLRQFSILMRRYWNRRSSLLLGCAIFPGVLDLSASNGSEWGQRLSRPSDATTDLTDSRVLSETLLGGLLTLKDTQILPRPGLGSPQYDYCMFGLGCRSTLMAFLPWLRGGLELPAAFPFPPVRNLSGEWYNGIHPVPLVTGNRDGRSLVAIQDSNLFTTANISWALHFFDDSDLTEDLRIVKQMQSAARHNILMYKRDDAFHFWPKQPSRGRIRYMRTGPFNLPIFAANLHRLVRMIPGVPETPGNPWFNSLFDHSTNPTGAEALANIPNDADDTAMALSVLALHQQREESTPSQNYEAQKSLQLMLRFRDSNRSQEDGRDAWKGHNSGGFLTWMRDEDESWFSEPEKGFIPLGVNNVDCVVNANVLLAYGLHQMTDIPEVRQVASLMHQAVSRKAWPECGLYYPQRMIFPYVLSRAWRDGGLELPDLDAALDELLPQILAEQLEDGSFRGDPDPTKDLSTALGLTSLINLGLERAEKIGLARKYRSAVSAAVRYLVGQRKEHDLHFRSTRLAANRLMANPDRFHQRSKGYIWKDGVFFSASRWSLAQWRSEAHTTAKVLEALGKFRIGYEKLSLWPVGNGLPVVPLSILVKDASTLRPSFGTTN